MPSQFVSRLAAVAIGALIGMSGAHGTEADVRQEVREAVDDAIKPVIAQYAIPGMAVAVTIDGTRYFIDYGVASKEPRRPVTRDTLFELGSISKTFTATLAAYAELDGKLSLNDTVATHMPELKGRALGDVRLVDLATHTAGGFPLQLPAGVKNRKQLIAYFRAWKPQFAAGTRRTYANPSIGLLGMVTAKAMNTDFVTLAERLFGELGLRRTYIRVPAAEMKSYAWGYNRDGKPVRVNPAPLADEAYGVKSNAADMIRFVEANMGLGATPEKASRAIQKTHTGYFHAGGMIQDLIWEQYPYPVALETLVAGNSAGMARNANPVTAIDPPMPPRGDVLLNKTGSTNGFGAYVAYVPDKKIGIVMLANRFYPNEARVRAAYAVLSRLAEGR